MARGINIAESKKIFTLDKKPVIFLSHKSEDKDFVEKIGEYLMNVGLDIYLDKDDLELQIAASNDDANRITKCIEDGIAKSDYILCFVSNKTVNSWWVPYEIGYGKKSGKGLATLVRKDVTNIPDFLRIEKVIESVAEINEYVKEISRGNKINNFNESSSDSSYLQDVHIKSAAKYYNLNNYLKI